MNNIVIFLPAGHDRPTGGVKMVYEYANRLSNDGFNVSIQYIASTFDNSNNVSDYLRTFFRYFYSLFRTTFLSCSWFSLNKNIHESSIFKIPTKHQFDSIAILTSVSTAINFFKSVKSYDPIKVVYFIQGYECWDIDEKELISTYQNPCKKIVIAKWLKNKILIKSSAVSYIVPNGFNFEQFYLSIPIKNKNKFCVSFLYHHSKVKDTPTGLEALFRVKKCIPELKVLMFGTYDLCEKLPDWIRYYKNPSLEIHNEINNTASIYLGSSKEEGWGLTIGEAMMCGQAVVCTDNLGYKEMAVNEENSLISPVGDPQSLADNIIRLINDDDFRIKLAERGYRHIQKYSIEESYKKFKQIIESTSL